MGWGVGALPSVSEGRAKLVFTACLSLMGRRGGGGVVANGNGQNSRSQGTEAMRFFSNTCLF